MHEWGTGHSCQAWVTCGTAIRTMQALLTHEPSKLTHPQKWQIFNRTLWSCYVMDRMVVSGVPQPNMLTCEALHTSWPSPSGDIAFGIVRANMTPGRSRDQLLRDMTGNMLHGYDAIVRGFDIWARILNMITSGGRRFPNINTPANYPWASGSPWRFKHGGNFKTADRGSRTHQLLATLYSAKLNNSHLSTLCTMSGSSAPPHSLPPLH